MQMLVEEILSPLSLKQDRRIAGLTRFLNSQRYITSLRDNPDFDQLSPAGQPALKRLVKMFLNGYSNL